MERAPGDRVAMSKKRRGARRTIEDSERWVELISCVGVSIFAELLPAAAARELHRGANLHVDANDRPTDRHFDTPFCSPRCGKCC